MIEDEKEQCRWSEQETQELIQMYYKGVQFSEMAQILHRTFCSVKARKEYLLRTGRIENRPKNAWTPEQEEYLKENWGKEVSMASLERHFGRSYTAIKRKADLLGLGNRRKFGGTGSYWTDEELSVLKRMYMEQGHRAIDIARVLGRSRNAVLGKLHRMELYAPSGQRHRVNRVYRLPNGKKRTRLQVLVRKAKEKAYVAEKKKRPSRYQGPTPHSLKVHLLDAGARDCRYMEGEDHLCCGHEIQEGSAYCPAHHALCYTPVPPRRRV